MKLIEYAADIYSWWTWELGRVRLLRRLSGVAEASATLHLGRSGVRIERAGSGAQVAELVDPSEAGSRLKALRAAGRLPRGAIDIAIGPDRYLERRLSRLRLPRSRMREMARLDFSAGTPFRPGECVLMLPDYRADRPDTSYFIVRRAHIDPLLDGLRQAGITLRRVLFVREGSVASADRPSISQIRRPSLAARIALTSTRATAATAILTLVALPAVAHWRNSAAMDVIEQEIAAAERKVEAVRQRLEERDRRIAEIAAARRAKSEAVPLVEVLEELARTLPDTTWLTDVEFEESAVTFTGRSEAAVELIPSLESSPLFRAPTFSLPVVRDAEQGTERFTITMQMEQGGG